MAKSQNKLYVVEWYDEDGDAWWPETLHLTRKNAKEQIDRRKIVCEEYDLSAAYRIRKFIPEK